VMRLAAEKMQAAWKQPVVIDNKPGAGGNLGSAEVARAAADGYTWLFGPDSLVTVNPHVYKNMPFKVEQLIPVTIATQFNQTLVCNPALGVKTPAELIAKAKAEPLSYASGGPGVPGHLSMELLMLKNSAGIEVVHVPYKGGAPAIIDLVGGRVQFLISGPPGVLPHIKAGRLKPIAVTAAKRSPGLPDTPTFQESGMPGFDTYEWYGVFAPGNLPKPILAKLSTEIARIIKLPEMSERLASQGALPVGNTSEEFAAFVKREMATWGKVAQKVGLKPD